MQTPPTEAFETIGSLIWATYAADRPLWLYPEALGALSQISKTVGDNWDGKANVPKSSYDSFAKWAKDVETNEWRGPPGSEPGAGEAVLSAESNTQGSVKEGARLDAEQGNRTLTCVGKLAFSDSSDHTGAFACIEDAIITSASQWSRERFLDSILYGECEALCRAAAALGRDNRFVIDNLVLHYICRKGHSSNAVVNRLLADTFGDRKPATVWCPTYLQIADVFTRGVPCPLGPARLADYAQVRQVPYDGGTEGGTDARRKLHIFQVSGLRPFKDVA